MNIISLDLQSNRMGIVARQSWKAGLATYGGTLLGILNILLVFPYCLTVSQLGEIQIVLTTAQMIGSIILVGGPLVITKFYPIMMADRVKTSVLFGLVFLIPIIIAILSLVASMAFREVAIAYFSKSRGAVSNIAFWATLLISLLTAFFSLFSSISALFGRIAIPATLTAAIKIVLPIAALALFFGYISYVQLFQLLVLFYVFLLVVIAIYTYRIGDFSISFNIKKVLNELPLKTIFTYSGINILAGIAYNLANQIDLLMVASMMSTHAAGLYVWSLFIGSAIIIPLGLISNVAGPIIARNWSNGELQNTQEIYSQSASTLLTLGTALLAAVVLSLDDLFTIMPKGDEYSQAKWLVFLLGVAKVIDMTFGVNHIILTYSKEYKYNLLFILISAVLNMGLNWLLIPTYGLEGCGIATVVSILVFNLCKWWFLKRNYKLSPFSTSIVFNLLIGIGLIVLFYFLPRFDFWLLNILVFGGGFVG